MYIIMMLDLPHRLELEIRVRCRAIADESYNDEVFPLASPWTVEGHFGPNCEASARAICNNRSFGPWFMCILSTVPLAAE
jgi:hypothetical protein